MKHTIYVVNVATLSLQHFHTSCFQVNQNLIQHAKHCLASITEWNFVALQILLHPLIEDFISAWPCPIGDHCLQAATLLTCKFNAQITARFSVGIAHLNTSEHIVARFFRDHDPQGPRWLELWGDLGDPRLKT